MIKRVYVSEISPWWTFERQEALLAAVLPGATVYRDSIDRRARQAHQVKSLVSRDEMLRPNRRGAEASETIWVASYAVLAWTADDMMKVLAKLEGRNATLVSIDDGPVDDVLTAWAAARVKSRLAGAALRGGAVTKRKMEAEYKPRVEAIRERWGDPAYSTAELLEEAGVTRNTANKYLGILRGEAIRKEAARLKRKATKEARGK